MSKVTVKFFDFGTWSDEPGEPSFNVHPGDEVEVTRDFAKYITTIGRAEVVHDPGLEPRVIPDNPTLADLELHPVTAKVLDIHGIASLADLLALTSQEVLDIKGIGTAKLEEIQTKLGELELRLAGH